jgi:caa(3)-type oxidase subunit IV
MAETTAHHDHPNYVKIWAILLGLLIVSVLGPMIGIQAVTLITAFGIALVKAYLVAKNFMHINVEPKFIVYLMSTMLVFMLLLFAGAAPDVMKFSGTNWKKPEVVQGAPGGHGSDSHGAEAGAEHH